MHNHEFGKIYQSTEYRRFKFLDGNRSIAESRVQTILESIQSVGYITNPIIVNEKMEIIDGQGRFTALKKLGLPVYYVVHEGAGIKEVISLNVRQKNWTTTDYCLSYARQGIEPYIWLVNVADRLNVSMDIAANIIKRKVSDSTNTKELVNGAFKCNKDVCDAILNRREFLHLCKAKLNAFSGKGLKARLLMPALDYCYAHEGTDKNRMWNIVEEKFDLIPPLNTGSTMLEALSEIYNKGLTKDKRMLFDALYKIEQD